MIDQYAAARGPCLTKMDDAGLIAWKKVGGVPRFKQYLSDMPGLPAEDVITDIGSISSHAAERLGYPTQKPLALLERIIKAQATLMT